MYKNSDTRDKILGFVTGAFAGALYGCYMGYILNGIPGAIFGTLMCTISWSVAGMLKGKQILDSLFINQKGEDNYEK